MRRFLLPIFVLVLGLSAMGQQSIQLRSVDRAECVSSDYHQLRASFSFSSLGANTIETPRGELSEIYIEGSYPNGNVGEPQLPMFTRLIAIPTGATPHVTVGAHSETHYTLSDYGIGTVAAMQAPVRKDVDPGTVEYAFSEAAYARNSYNDDPIAMVEVLGTMRGITLGRLIVQPVRYNPVAGTVKVFNNIEVSVDFENGDAEGTERMFKSTANVAFQSVYDQIFNIDMLMGGPSRDAYTDHPDFYNTPVRMLVICYSGFQGNDALNNWLQWKLQKGYYVDIYYTGSGSNNAGTTASAIASFIKTKYNASVAAGNAYTYLIVIGDTGQVPQYMTKTVDESCASDLGYSSVNFSSSTSNYFPDMYYSRISVENTTHLTNYMNKVLTYERFEFTDGGNYLNNVILVGGWDSSWTARVAKPTINYGTNYYFKSSNTTYGGFETGTINATISTSSTQGYSGSNNGCYNGINNGVCFLNYTAHGDKQEWYQPKMTAAHVATLTNTGKYFFAVGNCCLTGNFNNTSTDYSPGSAIGTTACFAETMIRVPNAGAVAYIGCSPYSYWYEDFYWAVGAHSYSQGNYPTQSASSKGVYDVMFEDQYWNSASALLYVGNLAVQQAVTNGNTNSGVTDGNCNNSAHYYFQFYHTFGDGSVMPYITKPEANTVTIPSTVTPGTASITVNAVAGSYVAVTDNSSVIYGVAEANSSGVATVNFTNAIPTTGTLHVVVTRQQYQPWFGTISVVGGTQYNLTYNTTEHGSISGPAQAYGSTTVTLTATPETGYCLSAWDVRDANNQPITVTNNQFTMPDSDVTVSATFVEGYTVTLATVANGSITADPLYALQGTTINLTATPASGYELASWHVYETDNVSNTVTVTDNSFTMPDFDVTVGATFSVPASYSYVKVTSEPDDWSGEYLIVYESGNLAFNGSLTTFDVSNNYISVTISNQAIECTSTTEASQFTIAPSGSSYTIQSASGYYIGRQANSNGLDASTTTQYTNTITFNNGNIDIVGSGGAYMRYNSSNFSGKRFRYYKSSTYTQQKAIQLYKKVGSGTVTPTYTITFNANGGTGTMEPQVVNDAEATVLNANTFTKEGYSFEGWNTAADGTGTFYADQTTVTLSADLTLYAQWIEQTFVNYILVTSEDQLVAGKTYLIVNKNAAKAMGAASSNGNNRSAVDIDINDDAITVLGGACELTLGMDNDHWTFFDQSWGTAGGYLYAASSSSNYLKTRANNSDANGQWSISIDSDGVASIIAQGTNTRNKIRYNSTNTLFACYASGQQDVYLFARVDPIELSQGWNWWAPTSEISLAQLEEALGSNGIIINSQASGFVRYENGQWNGTLTDIVPGQMYMIQTSAPCEITLHGSVPTNPTVTIHHGHNWFSYPGAQAASIATALGSSFTPTAGDKITSQAEGFAIFENGTWTGTLTTLQPGHGYIYMSNATEDQTIEF